jgi:hypothetical protein
MKLQKHSKNRVPTAVLLLSALLCLALVAGCTHGNTAKKKDDAAKPEAAQKTVDVQGADIAVTSWVSEKRPDENVSNEKDLSSIDIGLGAKGDQRIGLVRFDLPAGVTPQDLSSARLFIKKKGGDEPVVKAGTVSVPWDFAGVTWNDVKGKADFPDKSPVSEKDEGDWYALDVTDIVRGWLGGERANYGFALAGTEEGKVTSFLSASEGDAANYPRLSVTYAENKPAEKYGKYGYTEQSEKDGNCLSYALRDTSGIYDTDVFSAADKKTFEAALSKGGDNAMIFLKEKVLAYIDAHKKELGIEKYRPLENADDPINPEKEYVIAMKIGARDAKMAETAKDSFGAFDYHFRVKLDDGRWAEKIPDTKSRVTPGSNMSFDTGKYPWDADFNWGYSKTTDYYNSPAAYFAITKSTDDFTAHKGAAG